VVVGRGAAQPNIQHLGTSAVKAGADEEREGGLLGGGIEHSVVALVLPRSLHRQSQ
jgi:hypothetical protein